MSIQHNNHYVPQMYLNAWGSNNKIFEYKLLVSNEKVPLWSHPSIKKTAFQDKLYVRIEDEEEYDDFEKWFNISFETPAKAPLKRAIENDRMSPEDWEKIIKFVTAQYVRTPAFYQKHKELEKSVAQSAIEQTLQNISKLDIIETTNSSFTDSELFPVNVSFNRSKDNNRVNASVQLITGKNTWLFTIKHSLDNNSDTFKTLKSRKWSIADAYPGIKIPTSDNPFLIFAIDHNRQFKITDGLGRPENIIAFPISENRLLISTHKKIKPRFKLSFDDTLSIKNLIIQNAFLSVYSKHEDPEIPKMRARVVSEKLFNDNKMKLEQWFELYKKQEGPFLHRR